MNAWDDAGSQRSGRRRRVAPRPARPISSLCHMTKKLLIAAFSLLCAACLRAQSEPGQSPSAEKNPPPLDPKNMDTSVKPGDDFYLYANGTWIEEQPGPTGVFALGQLQRAGREEQRRAPRDRGESCAGPKRSAQAPRDVQKVGDFYASGMNEKAVDRHAPA